MGKAIERWRRKASGPNAYGRRVAGLPVGTIVPADCSQSQGSTSLLCGNERRLPLGMPRFRETAVIQRKTRQFDARNGKSPAAGSSAALGFTLIEMLITIAIITILTAIALPSYADYVRRGQLSGAFETLGTYQMRLEQSYQDGGNYGVTACSVTAPATTSTFQYTCALTNSGQGFTATATGVNTMAGYTFTVDNSGAQTTTAFPGGTGLPKSCWWTRKNDC